MTEPRQLRVFLCHSSTDKPIVRELYQRLNAEGWIDPWLDEEKLLPGQDWDVEIEKAVEDADAVIVCLSNRSVSKEGYIQKELRFVLDISDEKPEEAIFVTPIRIDNCLVPRRLKKWQYVDYFPVERRDWAYQRLLRALDIRLQEHELRNEKIAKYESEDAKQEQEAQYLKKVDDKTKEYGNEEAHGYDQNKVEVIEQNYAMETDEELALSVGQKGSQYHSSLPQFGVPAQNVNYKATSIFIVTLVGLVLPFLNIFVVILGLALPVENLALIGIYCIVPLSIILSLIGIIGGVMNLQSSKNSRYSVGVILSSLSLMLSCGSLFIFWYIDSNSLWCKFFPFISGC